MQTCRGNSDTRIASGWATTRILGELESKFMVQHRTVESKNWGQWFLDLRWPDAHGYLLGLPASEAGSETQRLWVWAFDRDWTTARLLKPASPLPPSPPNWASRFAAENTVHPSRLPVPRVPPKNATQAEMSRTPQSLVIQQVHHAWVLGEPVSSKNYGDPNTGR